MLTLVLATLLVPTTADPVELARVLKAGTNLKYRVESRLQIESRVPGLNTWMPDELDINYDFTMAIEKEKVDGIAEVRYQRPTITQILGETFERPPQKKVEKVNYDMRLTLSPTNDVLELKDLAKPAAKQSKSGSIHLMAQQGGSGNSSLIRTFLNEVYRLALFTGSFESALDLAPRLPTEAVAPGAQWKRTVGYTPQQLKGTGGKTVVQRLDYTYTYKGLVDSNGAKAHRIVADLNLDSDIAKFVHEVTGLKPAATKLKSAKLRLKANIQFDLDPKTFDTVRANATSDGGFELVTTTNPGRPQVEERFKGRTRLWLASRS